MRRGQRHPARADIVVEIVTIAVEKHQAQIEFGIGLAALRRQAEIVAGFFGIALDAQAFEIQHAEVVEGFCFAFDGGFFIPGACLRVVLRHTAAVAIQVAQVVHCGG